MRALLMAVLCILGAWTPLWTAFPLIARVNAAEPSPSRYMDEGLQAFQRGDIEGAAARWQEAVRLYAETQQPQAHSTALVHLAQAYEELGHYRPAAHSLRTALRLAQEADDRAQIASILGALGNVLVATGDLVEADQVLQDALALAHDFGNTGLAATILHTRGNLLLLRQQPHEAIEVYQESAALAQEVQDFGMAARALAHAALAAERQEQTQTATTLLGQALAFLQRAESSHDTAYDLLLIGRVYSRLASTDPDLLLQAAEVFREAEKLAQTLKDPRAASYAWGYLGRLYEAEHRYQEALLLTRRAVFAAQQVHMPESLYLWQWQSGRLLRALGEVQAAMAAYERAMATVQSMRTELLRGYRGVHGSFRASLGRLYFELADLFLRRATELESQRQDTAEAQYEAYLRRARDTIEQFKTVELRDYFGDACVDAASPKTTALDYVSPDTAIIYPILLPDRTELLVSLPSGLTRVVLPATGPALEQRVRIFRNALEDRDPLRYLRHAKRLYDWLMQPLEANLRAQHIRTLVWVPDGALRLLPIAALYDGQQFLIEKYAVAITPSLTLTDPRPLARDNVQVLAAGVAEAIEGLPALPRVSEELRGIQRLFGGAVLLGRAFSPEGLDDTLQQGQFGIVHIAAHGQFAAEASQSFLVTSQGKLTMQRLSQIVGRLRFRAEPIELLSLSACETARGDDRAALGLAGVAIQAGARSALATLWLVADDAAASLMTSFYQHLHESGVTRAQALQRAQVALLKQPQYADPFFWAPFLLLNNWL